MFPVFITTNVKINIIVHHLTFLSQKSNWLFLHIKNLLASHWLLEKAHILLRYKMLPGIWSLPTSLAHLFPLRFLELYSVPYSALCCFWIMTELFLCLECSFLPKFHEQFPPILRKSVYEPCKHNCLAFQNLVTQSVELVRNAESPSLLQTYWVCVITRPPGDSSACSGWEALPYYTVMPSTSLYYFNPTVEIFAYISLLTTELKGRCYVLFMSIPGTVPGTE